MSRKIKEVGAKKRIIYLKYKIEMKTGIELIAIERKEQIEKHGRTIETDLTSNTSNQLTDAVRTLIIKTKVPNALSGLKPPHKWDKSVWKKMVSKPYKERLIIAGALISAEIDRLQSIESTAK